MIRQRGRKRAARQVFAANYSRENYFAPLFSSITSCGATSRIPTELYIEKKQPELARTELQDVISDDVHALAFQRKRDRVWISHAKRLMGQVGK